MLVMGILNGGSLSHFIDVPSLLLTVGGALAAFLIATSLQEVVGIIGLVGYAFWFPDKYYAKTHPEMFEAFKLPMPTPATDEELASLRGKLERGAELLRRLRPYPIGMGAVGSMIGVINMLGNLDDPAAIGLGLATALITVFYGLVITFLLVIPLSQKLEARRRSLDEKFW